MTVAAVMQPYFVPYAGYFRLIAAADVFVVFDCVQFPRRGWVHRNRFTDANGHEQWLTLPLRKAPRDARIADLSFAPDAQARLEEQWRRFPVLVKTAQPGIEALKRAILQPDGMVVAYLIETLATVSEMLGLTTRFVRSSSLDLDPDLMAADRVRMAALAVDSDVYINAPGGRDLYDPRAFSDVGLDLRFLPPWDGPTTSILELLATISADEIATLVRQQTRLER